MSYEIFPLCCLSYMATYVERCACGVYLLAKVSCIDQQFGMCMLPLSQNNSEDDAASTDEEGDMSGGDTQEQVLSQFVHVLVCRCIVPCPMLQLLPNLDVVCVVDVEHTHISSPWLSLTLGRCTQCGTLWFHLSLLISTFHSILICTPPLPSFITFCSHPTFSFT